MCHTRYVLLPVTITFLLTLANQTNGQVLTAKQKQDSISLTAFTRKAYRWHNREILNDQGFEPKKNRQTDTLYGGIDFGPVNFMTGKLKRSGFFDGAFLENYRKIAARMDKELKNGTAVWREGRLPPFNTDADPWCNCPNGAGINWDKIRLVHLKFDQQTVSFDWTWGGDSYHKVKVKKDNGSWKSSYLQGFDMGSFRWRD